MQGRRGEKSVKCAAILQFTAVEGLFVANIISWKPKPQGRKTGDGRGGRNVPGGVIVFNVLCQRQRGMLALRQRHSSPRHIPVAQENAQQQQQQQQVWWWDDGVLLTEICDPTLHQQEKRISSQITSVLIIIQAWVLFCVMRWSWVSVEVIPRSIPPGLLSAFLLFNLMVVGQPPQFCLHSVGIKVMLDSGEHHIIK